MRLNRSLAAFGLPEFAHVFADELAANVHSLPLERFGGGGWPERIDSVFVASATDDGRRLILETNIAFRETIPSACPAADVRSTHLAFVRIAIDRVDGSATAEAIEPFREDL